MRHTGTFNVPQEMEEASLFKERINLVVSAKEVTYEYAFEEFL